MKNLNLKEFFGSTVLAFNHDGRTTVERRSNDGHIRRHLPVGLTKLLSLFLLLTLGVGQTWAEDIAKDAQIYFDNSVSNWSYNSTYFVINDDKGYKMSAIDRSKLYYHKRTANTWSGYSGIRLFAAASSWGDNDVTMSAYGKSGYQNMYDNCSNLSNWKDASYGFGSSGYHFIKLDKTGSKNSQANISVTYNGSKPTCVSTAKARVRSNYNGSYSTISTGSWPATVNMEGTYWSGDNASGHNNAATNSGAGGTYTNMYTGLVEMSISSLNSQYTFDGWATSAASSPSNTNATYSYNITSATTVYAYFTKKWTITFDKNGHGDESTPSTQYVAEGKKISAVSDLSEAGYTFDGWYTNSSCTGSPWNFASNTVSEDITLYAKWTPTTTTITLNKNAQGGSTVSGAASVTAIYNAALPSFTALSSTNDYALTGYWTAASGGTKIINANGTLVPNVTISTTPYTGADGIWKYTSSTLTLYAQWSLDRTLTYDGNGATSGSVPASATSYANGTNVTVLGKNTLAKTGYTFTGWNTAADGSGTPYAADASITMNANYTLFAQWSENMTTVTLASSPANSGTFTVGGGSATSTTAGVSTTRTVVATAQPGYKFSTWATTGNATGSYTNNTYTLNGSGSGGEGTLTANFARTYAFVEGRFQVKNAARTTTTYTGTSSNGYWATDSRNIEFEYDGTNHRFFLHTYMKPAELAAKLSNNTQYFTIQTSTSKSSLTGGSLYTPASTSPDSNQKLSASGSANKKATSTTANRNDSFLFTSSDNSGYAILYFDEAGVWYELEHTLEYGGNGGTGSAPASKTYYNHGVNATAASNTYSKAGYTFNGWKTGTNSGTSYAAGASVPMNSNITLYAQWQINNHAVTYTAPSHGNYTIKVGDASAVSANTTSDYNKTVTLAATPETGYHFVSWSVYKTGEPATIVTVTSNKFTMPDYPVTVSATFAANTYSVTFDANGGTGDAMSAQAFTYDAAQALSANTYTRTGYDFDGWATAANGAKVYNPGQSVSNLTNANGGTFPLFAHWTAKNYTVTLNIEEANHGTIDGKATSASVTFDATPTAITAGQLPTAAQGYAFMGFFTAAGGEGVQVINANGTWIASVTGYTDASGNWVRDGGITLYAYYKKAEITDLTLSASTVAPSSTFTVTPTISPAPTGTTAVCWTVLYAANDNELAPQPAISTEGTTATITAPATPGTYKVQAILHNTDCNGTELSRLTATFVVAGDHTVTVRYIGDGEQLQASTQLQANQLSWSGAITAPTVSGYTFAGWTAGEGITITGDNGDTEGTSSSNATIKVKATYAGTLTANYVETPTVYFYNNLGWSDVYVTYDAYWDDGYNQGTGNNGKTYHHMTRIEGTNIWYDEIPSTYTSGGFSGWAYNIAFNDRQLGNIETGNHQYFNSGNVIFRRDFDPYNTMFVPATTDVVPTYTKNGATYYSSTFTYYDNRNDKNEVTSRDYYYNGGYWKKYNKKYSGYSLRGTFANIIGDEKNWSGEEHNLYSETTEETENGWETSTSLKLSGNYNYYFRIYRNHLRNDQSSGYTNTGAMTVGANHANWRFETKQEWRGNNCTLSAATEGIYTFHVLFDKKGRIYVSVDYPMNVGDYRLLYKDDVHTTWHSSGTIASGNTEDIVSFFSRTSDKNPVIKWQYSTGIANNGTITWSTPADVSLTDWVGTDKVINDSAVYNFKVAYNAQSHTLALTDVKPYTGNYYIRTNSAGKYKWENYLNDPDHMMTYSEYAKTNGDYTHYWMAHVYANANVKFVIANDYSPCISDTLIQQSGDLSTTPAHVDATGNIHANANVRFMWDARNNKVQRAYLADAKEDGTEFLVLIAADDNAMKDANGNNLRQASASDEAGYNHGAPDHAVQFVDNENWIYEANVQLKPSAYVKLYANFDGGDFCYKGNSGSNFDGEEVDGKPNAIQLIGGDADLQNVRVVYDFKTDRLMAAWLPGDADITTETAINADVMIIRQHQDAGKQITFTGSGKLTDVKTVYGVMQFNRWTLNNKSTADGHAPLTGANSKSLYERALYFISFPFDVKVSEIFGFGKYWDEWYIEYYDGKSRAANGYWIDSEPNWKYVTPEMAKTFELKANQGYILGLDLDYMKDDNTTFWANDIQNVSLYFPSTTSVNNIQATSAVIPALTSDYYCKINRGTPDGDRRVKDSYWRCIGVPSYANYSNTLTDGENPIVWQTGSTLPYIYQWNMTDNTLTPQSTSNFAFLTMHAYLAQYEGAIHWSAVSATPSPIVARRTADETIQDREFRLELAQAQKMLDQTYVRLSMDEEVTTGFEFNHDLTKEINAGKANIYTYIGYEKAAANCLPMSNQTTIVPMGVQIAADGEYTFAMPDGTNGTGVTLIDNETGTRTSLALTDYTVTLGKGTYDNRFVLEFSPVAQTPTGIEDAEIVNRKSPNRKLLIDGILYIVKDGQVFDARGTKVK